MTAKKKTTNRGRKSKKEPKLEHTRIRTAEHVERELREILKERKREL